MDRLLGQVWIWHFIVYLVAFDWIQLAFVNVTGAVEYLNLTVFFFF